MDIEFYRDVQRTGSFAKAMHKRKEPSYYDTMQVCAEGHQITAFAKTSPQRCESRCSRCGAATFTGCPKCNAPVRGHYHVDGVSCGFGTPIPTHCYQCGDAYPWADKVQKAGESQPETMESLVRIFDHFDQVARLLKHRHNDRETLRIKDEYDVQDLLYPLLSMYFPDIRDEEPSPSHAGAGSRLDFLLKGEKTVIEVKKTREDLSNKKLGEQLLIDIARYREHPDCETLLFFIYDPTHELKNPRGLERDCEIDEPGFKVRVFVRPTGRA